MNAFEPKDPSWIDAQGEPFEEAWERGERPRIEDYLAGVSEPARTDLLRHLLVIELQRRRGSGEQPTPEEYRARFPEHSGLIADCLDEIGLSPGGSLELANGQGMKARGPAHDEARDPDRTVPYHPVRVPGPPADAPGAEGEHGPAIPGYEILGKLGGGGMGVVYRAWQAGADRVVALKVIRPDFLEGLSAEQRRQAVERFVTEAQAAQLEHEHLVSVYQVGEADGRPFYAMRYVEGASLHDLIRAGPLEPRRAAAYLEPVARAVHEAHRHGILHRDLKPHNVLVEARSDRPLVADFGLAKLVHGGREMTRTSDVLGTPPYMSPEQARSSAQVTVASDVYGLGATLYALLTGRPPFQGEAPVETLRQVLEAEPARPRSLNPAVDRDLETVCLKCLDKDPRRRYGSAEALADELQRWLRGEPIVARRTGVVGRWLKWARRRPAAAALLAVLVIATPGSTYLAVVARQQANQAEENGRKATQALEDLEREVVDGLLLPIGRNTKHIDPAEVDALWRLAGLSNDRMRLLFLTKALERPDTAKRLARRTDGPPHWPDRLDCRARIVAHAIAGLDSERKRCILQVLTARLQDKRTDLRIREACVHVGVTLQPTDAVFAGAAAVTIVEAVDNTADPDGLTRLARAFAVVAGQLETEEARRLAVSIAKHFVEQMKADSTPRLYLLAEALGVVLDRVGGEEARRLAALAAKRVVEVAKGTSRRELEGSLKALEAVSGRLGADEAASVAKHLVENLGTVRGLHDRRGLDRVKKFWGVVSGRLGADEAASVAKHLVEQITKVSVDQWAKVDDHRYALIELAEALGAVSAQLKVEDARRFAAPAAKHLVELMVKTTDPHIKCCLAEAFAAVSGMLGADEARRLSASAAKHLAERMTKVTDSGDGHRLGEALAGLPAPQALAPERVVAPRPPPECYPKPGPFEPGPTLLGKSAPNPAWDRG
jgi:predicted Ser/Thr protein kinase